MNIHPEYLPSLYTAENAGSDGPRHTPWSVGPCPHWTQRQKRRKVRHEKPIVATELSTLHKPSNAPRKMPPNGTWLCLRVCVQCGWPLVRYLTREIVRIPSACFLGENDGTPSHSRRALTPESFQDQTNFFAGMKTRKCKATTYMCTRQTNHSHGTQLVQLQIHCFSPDLERSSPPIESVWEYN